MKQYQFLDWLFGLLCFFLWINFDLLYCYDISLENFTESTFLQFFTALAPPSWRTGRFPTLTSEGPNVTFETD